MLSASLNKTFLSLSLSLVKCTVRVSDFQWVEGDTCEVQIQVINPLKVELKLQYIVRVYTRMNEWMDGWMDGWMNE